MEGHTLIDTSLGGRRFHPVHLNVRRPWKTALTEVPLPMIQWVITVLVAVLLVTSACVAGTWLEMRMRREPMTREIWIALAILGPVIFLGLFLLMFIKIT
jgi:hypothetical protein